MNVPKDIRRKTKGILKEDAFGHGDVAGTVGSHKYWTKAQHEEFHKTYESLKDDYEKVQLIHKFIKSDLNTDYGKRDDKSGHPVINMEYVEEAGGVDNPGWAAYHVTFPPEYSKKFSGAKAGGTAPFEAEEFEEIMKNGYTVFLKEDFDNSPFKYINRPRSSVGSYIKQNDQPYGDAFDGGGEFYIF